jgi:predicted nucleic acid-binding protein
VIAADTSAWVDFSNGSETNCSKHLETALSSGNVVMPMIVMFEILSGPGLTDEVRSLILQLPQLELLPGYWERAGDLRRGLLKRGLKARSMDCLVAQSCIDHKVALIAADGDYRHFAKSGLKLVS